MQLVVRPSFIFSCPRARVGFPRYGSCGNSYPSSLISQISSSSATRARYYCPTLSWADMLWRPNLLPPPPSAQSTSRLDRSLDLLLTFCRCSHLLQTLTSPADRDWMRLQLSSVAKIKLYFKNLPATFKITSQFALLALVLIVDTQSCEVIVLCYFFPSLHKINNTVLHKTLQASKLTKIPP